MKNLIDRKKEREIKQLWNISKKYFSLALDEKLSLSGDNMNYTVDYLTNLKTVSKLKNYDNILLFTAHLSSCAIRLFSIDENLSKMINGGRLRSYYKLDNWSDKEKMQKDIKDNLSDYIHFLLRNTICHAEWKKFKEESYKKMYELYLTLTLNDIFNNMQELMTNMEKDLKNIKIT